MRDIGQRPGKQGAARGEESRKPKMRMSTKGRYGLRVMVELAVQHGKGPVMAEALAERQQLSPSYAQLLLGGLKSAGLVRSMRGPSGGYELTRAPSEITALDVVAALEDAVPVECVAGLSKCKRASICPTREVWQEVSEAVNAVLSRYTLEQLAQRQLELQTPAPMYEI
jgi:Rrf2 family protein